MNKHEPEFRNGPLTSDLYSYKEILDKKARQFYSMRHNPELSAQLPVVLTQSKQENANTQAEFINLRSHYLVETQESLEVNTMATELRKTGSASSAKSLGALTSVTSMRPTSEHAISLSDNQWRLS